MNSDLFRHPGAVVIVDGQFGSTGKGVVAGALVEKYHGRFNKSTSNAGPNSGHTAYLGDTKVVSCQLPITGLVPQGSAHEVTTLLNGGAIVDPVLLMKELNEWDEWVYGDVWVNPQAVMITDDALQQDMFTVNNISGTGKGTGPALAQKVLRVGASTMRYWEGLEHLHNSNVYDMPNFEAPWDWNKDRVVVECSQGFSLGYHSQFWPYTTSRECTVMQAIADARIPASMVRDVIMCVRTYPIRVGNAGPTGSGGYYGDQQEIQWEDIGIEPELTTVTKRQRRIFTFSHQQFRHALAANRPTVLFINFMNYIDTDMKRFEFLNKLREDVRYVGLHRVVVWGGFGPRTEDIQELGIWP